MAESQTARDGFEERARANPYDSMTAEDKEFLAREFEVLPIDATKSDKLSDEMSFAERNIGLSKSVLCITDYGRHRGECDTLADFEEMVREKIADGIPSQYLKVMGDDKERVADTLLAITRANGYVVVPYFED